MAFWIMKTLIQSGIIFLALAGALNAATPLVRELKPVDDPLILPYRFEIRDKLISKSFDNAFPIMINKDGNYGMLIIGGRAFDETASSILFYSDIERHNAIWHYHIPTDNISLPLIADFDNDNLEEAAVCYVRGDSLWLEIVDVEKKVLLKKFIISGVDRDKSGVWDAYALMLKAHDFNGDGFKDILFSVDTGYDLYPRCIVCLDWKNDNILWRYDMAGIINCRNVHLVENPSDGRLLVAFGVASKGNAAVAGDMDDSHSYLIVLDGDGHELWKVETGTSFTTAAPVVYDFNHDNALDILVARSLPKQTDTSDSSVSYGMFLELYNLEGTLIANREIPGMSMVREIQLYDYNSNGIPEIFITASQRRMVTYDHNLDMLEDILGSASFSVFDCRDFLGRGDNQILIAIEATKLLLTDGRFGPLAEIEAPGPFNLYSYRATHISRPSKKITITVSLGINSDSYVYELVKAPWHTIFSRKPLLAFLAGAVPLGIIAAIIWAILTAFRRKNRIIEDQRNRLDKALTELKEAQEELIAAEKYKQAKDIAGGVAHEILNALYPARTALDTLKNRLDDHSSDSINRQQKLMDLAERAIDRAMTMVELVKIYSRLDAEKKTDRNSLAEIVAEIIDSNRDMVEGIGATIRVDVPEEIGINIYRPHAYSLLNNLFLNSLQAMESSPRKEVHITAAVDADQVRIELADTGPGIPEENKARVFDTFFTTRPSAGTGLGLSIVKRIVALYDGRIFLESKLDSGTKFIILVSGHE
jgi:signal transduction histidine kinase